MSTIRFLLAFPFGLMAELFLLLAIKISGNQINLDFKHLRP